MKRALTQLRCLRFRKVAHAKFRSFALEVPSWSRSIAPVRVIPSEHWISQVWQQPTDHLAGAAWKAWRRHRGLRV